MVDTKSEIRPAFSGFSA